MLEGKINPEDVKVEGIETEEEKKVNEVIFATRTYLYFCSDFNLMQRIRLEKRMQQQEKERQLKIKRKQEEIERWWAGAEFFKPNNNNSNELVDSEDLAANPVEKIKARYNFDYSRFLL